MPKQEKTTENGSEVATRENGTVAVPQLALQFRDWVHQQAEADDGGFAAMAGQLDKILAATTFEEIMAADFGGVYESRDLIGLEIELQNVPFRWAKSAERFQGGLGVFIQFRATALSAMPGRAIAIGDELLITSGAPLVIGKLRTLEANECLPCSVKIIGVEASAGTVVKLGMIPPAAKPVPSAAE